MHGVVKAAQCHYPRGNRRRPVELTRRRHIDRPALEVAQRGEVVFHLTGRPRRRVRGKPRRCYIADPL